MGNTNCYSIPSKDIKKFQYLKRMMQHERGNLTEQNDTTTEHYKDRLQTENLDSSSDEISENCEKLPDYKRIKTNNFRVTHDYTTSNNPNLLTYDDYDNNEPNNSNGSGDDDYTEHINNGSAITGGNIDLSDINTSSNDKQKLALCSISLNSQHLHSNETTVNHNINNSSLIERMNFHTRKPLEEGEEGNEYGDNSRLTNVENTIKKKSYNPILTSIDEYGPLMSSSSTTTMTAVKALSLPMLTMTNSKRLVVNKNSNKENNWAWMSKGSDTTTKSSNIKNHNLIYTPTSLPTPTNNTIEKHNKFIHHTQTKSKLALAMNKTSLCELDTIDPLDYNDTQKIHFLDMLNKNDMTSKNANKGELSGKDHPSDKIHPGDKDHPANKTHSAGKAHLADKVHSTDKAHLADKTYSTDKAHQADKTHLADKVHSVDKADLTGKVHQADKAHLADKIHLVDKAQLTDKAYLASKIHLVDKAYSTAKADLPTCSNKAKYQINLCQQKEQNVIQANIDLIQSSLLYNTTQEQQAGHEEFGATKVQLERIPSLCEDDYKTSEFMINLQNLSFQNTDTPHSHKNHINSAYHDSHHHKDIDFELKKTIIENELTSIVMGSSSSNSNNNGNKNDNSSNRRDNNPMIMVSHEDIQSILALAKIKSPSGMTTTALGTTTTTTAGIKSQTKRQNHKGIKLRIAQFNDPDKVEQSKSLGNDAQEDYQIGNITQGEKQVDKVRKGNEQALPSPSPLDHHDHESHRHLIKQTSNVNRELLQGESVNQVSIDQYYLTLGKQQQQQQQPIFTSNEARISATTTEVDIRSTKRQETPKHKENDSLQQQKSDFEHQIEVTEGLSTTLASLDSKHHSHMNSAPHQDHFEGKSHEIDSLKHHFRDKNPAEIMQNGKAKRCSSSQIVDARSQKHSIDVPSTRRVNSQDYSNKSSRLLPSLPDCEQLLPSNYQLFPGGSLLNRRNKYNDHVPDEHSHFDIFSDSSSSFSKLDNFLFAHSISKITTTQPLNHPKTFDFTNKPISTSISNTLTTNPTISTCQSVSKLTQQSIPDINIPFEHQQSTTKHMKKLSWQKKLMYNIAKDIKTLKNSNFQMKQIHPRRNSSLLTSESTNNDDKSLSIDLKSSLKNLNKVSIARLTDRYHQRHLDSHPRYHHHHLDPHHHHHHRQTKSKYIMPDSNSDSTFHGDSLSYPRPLSADRDHKEHLTTTGCTPNHLINNHSTHERHHLSQDYSPKDHGNKANKDCLRLKDSISNTSNDPKDWPNLEHDLKNSPNSKDYDDKDLRNSNLITTTLIHNDENTKTLKIPLFNEKMRQTRKCSLIAGRERGQEGAREGGQDGRQEREREREGRPEGAREERPEGARERGQEGRQERLGPKPYLPSHVPNMTSYGPHLPSIVPSHMINQDEEDKENPLLRNFPNTRGDQLKDSGNTGSTGNAGSINEPRRNSLKKPGEIMLNTEEDCKSFDIKIEGLMIKEPFFKGQSKIESNEGKSQGLFEFPQRENIAGAGAIIAGTAGVGSTGARTGAGTGVIGTGTEAGTSGLGVAGLKKPLASIGQVGIVANDHIEEKTSKESIEYCLNDREFSKKGSFNQNLDVNEDKSSQIPGFIEIPNAIQESRTEKIDFASYRNIIDRLKSRLKIQSSLDGPFGISMSKDKQGDDEQKQFEVGLSGVNRQEEKANKALRFDIENKCSARSIPDGIEYGQSIFSDTLMTYSHGDSNLQTMALNLKKLNSLSQLTATDFKLTDTFTSQDLGYYLFQAPLVSGIGIEKENKSEKPRIDDDGSLLLVVEEIEKGNMERKKIQETPNFESISSEHNKNTFLIDSNTCISLFEMSKETLPPPDDNKKPISGDIFSIGNSFIEYLDGEDLKSKQAKYNIAITPIMVTATSMETIKDNQVLKANQTPMWGDKPSEKGLSGRCDGLLGRIDYREDGVYADNGEKDGSNKDNIRRMNEKIGHMKRNFEDLTGRSNNKDCHQHHRNNYQLVGFDRQEDSLLNQPNLNKANNHDPFHVLNTLQSNNTSNIVSNKRKILHKDNDNDNNSLKNQEYATFTGAIAAEVEKSEVGGEEEEEAEVGEEEEEEEEVEVGEEETKAGREEEKAELGQAKAKLGQETAKAREPKAKIAEKAINNLNNDHNPLLHLIQKPLHPMNRPLPNNHIPFFHIDHDPLAADDDDEYNPLYDEYTNLYLEANHSQANNNKPNAHVLSKNPISAKFNDEANRPKNDSNRAKNPSNWTNNDSIIAPDNDISAYNTSIDLLNASTNNLQKIMNSSFDITLESNLYSILANINSVNNNGGNGIINGNNGNGNGNGNGNELLSRHSKISDLSAFNYSKLMSNNESQIEEYSTIRNYKSIDEMINYYSNSKNTKLNMNHIHDTSLKFDLY